MEYNAQKSPRQYLPESFTCHRWENIEPVFLQLLNKPVNNVNDLIELILYDNEFSMILHEYRSRVTLNSRRDTNNPVYKQEYDNLHQNIYPNYSEKAYQLNQKIIGSPYVDQLPEYYRRYIKLGRVEQDLFRSENIPIIQQIAQKIKEYSEVTANRTTSFAGKEQNIYQLGTYFHNSDRSIRQDAWLALAEMLKKDAETLNHIFSDLVKFRHKMAINAGFSNFRDFRFMQLKRFDYTAEDCFHFHYAVEKVIRPLADKVLRHRCQVMNLPRLRPWDLRIKIYGDDRLRPFAKTSELIEKTITILSRIYPGLENTIRTMNEVGFLDLATRTGKANGGFQVAFPESKLPFIFMNATGHHHNAVTMLHESGHAIHTVAAAQHQSLLEYRYPAIETAELASMSMELLSMSHWNEFYPDEKDFIHARIELLENIILQFPNMMKIDAFQHWLYQNPDHTIAERTDTWVQLGERFTKSDLVDISGLKEFFQFNWQLGHIFQSPFYYIEYAIAQLGALQIWRNYHLDPEKTIQDYLAALALGNSVPVPEVYRRAGIRFDFSEEILADLMRFVDAEWSNLIELA